MPATKSAILASYAEQIETYPWAQADRAKFERFMSAARNTLTPGSGQDQVDQHGHSWKRALELNGIHGAKDQALKRLRALPEA